MLNDDVIHVLICHTNPLVAAGLSAAFKAESDFHLVECGAPDEMVHTPYASVVVTDGERGTHLAQLGARVLILTDDESEVSIRRAIERGIGGYLPLSSSVDTVVHAVRCIHRGGTAFAPSVVSKMAMSLRCSPLTEREVEVLGLIMQGLPDKAIARRLERSLGTAKSHVKSILAKLDASTRVEAAAVARRRGLVLEKSAAMSAP